MNSATIKTSNVKVLTKTVGGQVLVELEGLIDDKFNACAYETGIPTILESSVIQLERCLSFEDDITITSGIAKGALAPGTTMWGGGTEINLI